MQIGSAIAIYVLFWVLCAFLVLPLGVRTPDETGEALVPGQAESAPSNFNPKRVLVRTTWLSAILFAAYYLNYVNGWVGPEVIDFIN